MIVFTNQNPDCSAVRRLMFVLALSSITQLAACDGSRNAGAPGGVASLARIGNNGTAVADNQVAVSEGQVV